MKFFKALTQAFLLFEEGLNLCPGMNAFLDTMATALYSVLL